MNNVNSVRNLDVRLDERLLKEEVYNVVDAFLLLLF